MQEAISCRQEIGQRQKIMDVKSDPISARAIGNQLPSQIRPLRTGNQAFSDSEAMVTGAGKKVLKNRKIVATISDVDATCTDADAVQMSSPVITRPTSLMKTWMSAPH